MATQEPMTVDRAKNILKDTIALFATPENKERLLAATEQANAVPADQQ